MNQKIITSILLIINYIKIFLYLPLVAGLFLLSGGGYHDGTREQVLMYQRQTSSKGISILFPTIIVLLLCYLVKKIIEKKYPEGFQIAQVSVRKAPGALWLYLVVVILFAIYSKLSGAF